MNAGPSLHDDAVLRLARSRNLVVAVWLDAPSLDHVHAFARAMALVAREYPEDFAVLNVVVSGVPSFSDEVRTALGKLVSDPKLQGHGGAHVVLVAGFAGVAVRAFLSTVFLLGRGRSPNKVFSDVRTGATWLAPRLSSGRERWSIDDLARAARAAVDGALPVADRRPS